MAIGKLGARGGFGGLGSRGRPSSRQPTYYFASNGSDANDGRSINTPKQTITAFNALTLSATDYVAFRGGDTFSGALVLPGGGSILSNIIVGSYGVGKAIISSGSSAGFTSTNREYFTLTNLEFAGDQVTPNAVNGVYVRNTQAAAATLRGIVVSSLLVHHYGWNGIFFDGSTTNTNRSGFTDASISGCTVYSCTHNKTTALGTAGIMVQGTYGAVAGFTNYNVTISSCTVYDCLGTAGDTNWNGSGIFLGECNVGLIDGCMAYNCGQNNTNSAGPVGIWTADSKAVVIQLCTSHDNKSGVGTFDGGGFDLDGGCQDCVVQYCLAYNNFGAGFQAYEYGDPGVILPYQNNTIRYNISIDDNSSASAGSLNVVADWKMTAVKIYNNTVYQSRGATYACINAVTNTGTSLTDYEGYIANNIFYSANASRLVLGGSNFANMRFRGNNYYAASTFTIRWNSVNYASVAAWQAVATTQEKISGSNVSLSANPSLVNPGTTTATDYKLQGGSAMIGAGLNLNSQFSINPGTRDYFGNAIAAPYSIGACQTP